eukprot:jgi/Mesvir1/23846/Mv10649-RA.1
MSGSQYVIEVVPSGEGTITVDVAAGVATDAAGNGNTAASQLSFVYDITGPTVALSTLAVLTNTSPVTVTVTFNEPVTGFELADITVEGGTAGALLDVTSSQFTVQITPLGQGVVTVDVAAGVVTDAAGNGNTAAPKLAFTFDSVNPTVSLTTSSPATNISPVPVTITFSSDVVGLIAGDVVVGGGTMTSFTAVSNSQYVVEVTPLGEGTLTVGLGAGVATDAAGNPNTAASQLTIVYDATAPTVALTTAALVANASPVEITATFSKSVSGFVAGDVLVAAGTVGSFVAVNASHYLVEVVPSGQGTVTVDVTAGAAVDAAGNGNIAASQLSFVYDSVRPTVTLSTAATATNSPTVLVTITFSESVSGFIAGDVVVGGGTVTSSTAVSGSQYVVELVPSGEGTMTVDIAGNVATDTAGNGNTAATQLSIVYDTTAPSVALTTSSSSTNASPVLVTVTFSEPVSGFTTGDVVVGGGTVGSITVVSGSQYVVEVMPSREGSMTVDIAGGVATDAAGNGNTAAAQLGFVYDTSAPAVVISTAVSITNISPISATVTFSEQVSGFVAADVVIGGSTLTSFTAVSGSQYVVELTPSGQGLITVDVPAAVAIDAAGNVNSAATQLTVTYDTSAPTVTLSTLSLSTNSLPVLVTVTFSEDVVGFGLGDIVVGGGTVTSFTVVSGSQYVVELTPSGEGTLTVDVAANVATDSAGNGNTAASQLAIIYDMTVPTVALSTSSLTTSTSPVLVTVTFYEPVSGFTAGGVVVGGGTVGSMTVVTSTTNVSPIPVTITFSEAVTGFVLADVVVTGGTAGSFSTVSTLQYTVQVTPSGQGTVTVNVGAGVALDTAGNANTAAPELTITYDTTAPSVALTTSFSSTSASPVFVTVTFSEAVSGFTTGDVVVGGGTVGSITVVSGSHITVVDGSQYMVEVVPSGEGLVTVDVAANVVTDAAGNGNTAATPLAIVYDTTAPAVSLTTAASVTNVYPVLVTVTFTEAVFGFTAGDVVVGGGTVSSITVVSSLQYVVELVPSGEGTMTVDIAGNVATDAAGNGNTAATQLSIVYDMTAPSVALTTSSSSTNASPVLVTVTFSEPVSGFTTGDVVVGGGTVGSITVVSGLQSVVEVVPSGEGSLTVALPAGVATDAAGNVNTAATPISIVYDTTAPTVLISTASPATNTAPITVTVTFSELVSGFTAGDVVFAGGTVTSFVAVSGSQYVVELTPSGEGTLTVDVAANVATDAAGNGNTQATQLSIVYDTTGPSVALTTAAPATNLSPLLVTITFSEAVFGFAIADMVVSGGTATSLAANDASHYLLTVTPLGEGAVVVSVPAAVATDAAGNSNVASTLLTITYDTTAPTVALTASAFATNTSPIYVTLTFSESVFGFTAGDVTVAGGTVDSIAVVSGSQYVVEVVPSGEGTLTVDVAAGVATDAAGNSNIAAPPLFVVYDITAPAVVLTTASPSTSVLPVLVTVTFSSDVLGLIAGDVVVAGGTMTSFTVVSGSQYVVELTPSGEGTLTVDVAANVATDAAGNGNTPAAQLIIVYDTTAPSVALTTASASTNVSPILVTVTFSEAVSGLALADVVVAGGTAGSFTTVSGSQYTFEVTPSAEGTVTVDVPAGIALDAAGNANTAAPQLAIAYDTTSPTVSISTSSPSTNASPVLVTITFSESVTGFTAGDITVVGGTVGSITVVDGSQYMVEVVPSGEGLVAVDVAANVVTDAAGNGNTAATPLAIVYDTTAPAVSLTTAASVTNVYPVLVTVTFTEAVFGFTAGDVVVGGGTVSSITVVSSLQYVVELVPSGEGTMTVDIAGNVATDAAGNGNTAATQLSIVYDMTAPSVALTTSSSSTNASPVLVTVTFSEPVSGFTTGDVVVGGGTVGSITVVSGLQSVVEVVPSGEGSLTVALPAGVATDAAGNVNTAATPISIVYDTTAPTVLISTASPATNTAPITVTVTFSELVSGFTAGDVVFAGGTVTSFVAVSGSQYVVELTPSGEGTLTVDVAANVATDVAGNGNTQATQLSIVYDTTGPSVALTTAAPATNLSPLLVTITFSEAVFGFAIADMVVSGGTATSLAANDASHYLLTVTPLGEGAVVVSVPAAVATDAAGNSNVASTLLTITYDTTAPTVALTASAFATNTSPIYVTLTFTGNSNIAAPPLFVVYDITAPAVVLTTASPSTSVLPVLVTVTFSSDVLGLIAGDVVVAGGTMTSFTVVSGSQYVVELTPSGEGTLTVDVAANVATDAAGNGNTPAAQLIIVYDTTAPSVALTTASASTNVSPILVTVTFSEAVSGLALADVVVAGGTAGSFTTVSGSQYTFEVTPSAEGTVTVDVPAGIALDAAGNANTAAPQLAIAYDTTSPTVSISTSSPSTNASPVLVTITFSESVTGFTAGDITVVGGTVGSITVVDGSQYTVEVVPSGEGLVTVDVAANVVTDAAGNGNTAATPLAIVYDTTAPAVSLTTAGSIANASPVLVTVTFTDVVFGFTAGDVVVGGGSAGSITVVSGSLYVVEVVPSGEGTLTVDVAGGAVTDAAGNGNTPATQLVIIYDVSPPCIILTTALPSTNLAPILVTVTFSDPITGFGPEDVLLSGGTVDSFSVTSAAVYTFAVMPSGEGLITVNVPAGVAWDAAGNANSAAAPLTFVYDTISPTTALTTLSLITNANPVTVTVTFNADVTGFGPEDVVVGGGTVGAVTSISSSQYTVQVLPAAEGLISVDVLAGGATDDAGNGNAVSNHLVFQYDATPPTVMLATLASPTNVSPIVVTLTFSEDVVGISLAGLLVTGAYASSYASMTVASMPSAAVYTVDLVPQGDGLVTLEVPAGSVTDLGGNPLVFPATLSVAYDATPPTVVLGPVSGQHQNYPLLVTVAFSESVTLAPAFLTTLDYSNGAGRNLQQYGPQLLALVLVPHAKGLASVRVPSGVAWDAAGNGNAASEVLWFTYDVTKPVARLTSTSPVDVDARVRMLSVTAEFDEEVTGFSLRDSISVQGVSLVGLARHAMESNGTQAVWRYHFVVAPNLAVGTTDPFQAIVQLETGMIRDLAGNLVNILASDLVVTFRIHRRIEESALDLRASCQLCYNRALRREVLVCAENGLPLASSAALNACYPSRLLEKVLI